MDIHIRGKNKGRFICILVVVFWTVHGGANAQFRTQIFDSEVKTLQVNKDGEKYTSNNLKLGSDEKLTISFDQLSHLKKNYSYRILHCNADWTQSALMTNEYIEGFTTAPVTDYQLSRGTTVLYTNYRFVLPNNDMKFRISGNYLVQIYEDDNAGKIVAQLCLYVYEPKVSIIAELRSNTDIELSGRYQQLDFDVNTGGLYLQNPSEEIKVVVRQNNRNDNEVTGLKPTAYVGNKLSYARMRQLIFEGGNEFHVFDISSAYTAARGVDKISYVDNHYQVKLIPDELKPAAYVHSFDANGKYIINYQEAIDNVNMEADYMNVVFELNASEPFFDGLVYCTGDFNENLLDDKSRMTYDFQRKKYVFTTQLKQGGYNYQYRFVPKGTKTGQVGRVEGSFWQTTNEYAIFVYHRSPADRYDKLLGIKMIE